MADHARRRGFALITVLWVMAGATIVLLHHSLPGRDAFNAARNRALSARGAWIAEACLEVVRARVDDVLADSLRGNSTAERWSALDKALTGIIDSLRQPLQVFGAGSTAGSGRCDVSLEAVGSRLDLNTAGDAELRQALSDVIGDVSAAQVTDALLDWRDADDDPRPLGAERVWYTTRQRVAPRNGALADVPELALLRGLEDSTVLASAASVLGVEQGLISLNNAPAAVLKTIPGIADEAANALVQANQLGQPITDLIQFSSTLSANGANLLRSRYPDIVRLSLLEPGAWTIRARSTVGWPAVTTDIELRMTRMGMRAAIVRRRSWT